MTCLFFRTLYPTAFFPSPQGSNDSEGARLIIVEKVFTWSYNGGFSSLKLASTNLKPFIPSPHLSLYQTLFSFQFSLCTLLLSSLLFGRTSTPGKSQIGLGPKIYSFTTLRCCTVQIGCWK